jgi:hypothetical protein
VVGGTVSAEAATSTSTGARLSNGLRGRRWWCGGVCGARGTGEGGDLWRCDVKGKGWEEYD